MKKRLLFVLLCAGFSGSGLVHAADAECKKIVMTGHSNYTPLSWRDRTKPTEITAIASEMVAMAMKEKGVPVEFKYVGPWKRAHAAVKAGEVDAIHGAYMTEERKTYLDYTSTPYIMDPTVVFVKKGKPFPFKKKEDLIGLSGATPLGESYGDEFDNYAKTQLKIDLTTSFEVAFKKLLADRSQYVIAGLYPGQSAAQAAGIADQIEYLPVPLITEGMYVGFSKKSPCGAKYQAYLSEKIAEYVKQGVSEKLLKKYTALWQEQSKLKEPE